MITEHYAGKPKRKWPSTEWARKTRDGLIATLGAKCVRCKGRCCLTLDHIDAIDWSPHALSWSQRMAEYKRAHAKGNLQILCIRCHGKKSAADQANIDKQREAQPF